MLWRENAQLIIRAMACRQTLQYKKQDRSFRAASNCQSDYANRPLIIFNHDKIVYYEE